MVLGHQHPNVVQRVREQLESGVLFGGQHEGELQLAEGLVRNLPSAERVTFCSTGSEGVHLAIGVARGVTGRQRIIKFEGHLHGWIAPMVVNTNAEPPFSGKPEGPPGWTPVDDIAICHWNNIADVEAIFAEDEPVAAVILEPIATDAGLLPIDVDFLRAVRELCDQDGALLIFDEIITGFRVDLHSAQGLLGVLPDLTIVAKAFGAGFPISAVAAPERIWQAAVDAGVKHSGTFNGHAISVAAANGALSTLESEAETIYPRLHRYGDALSEGLRSAAAEVGAPLMVNQFGPILNLYWGLDSAPTTYTEVRQSDTSATGQLEAEFIARGVLTLRGSRWFVSAAHTDRDLEITVDVAKDALRATAADHPA